MARGALIFGFAATSSGWRLPVAVCGAGAAGLREPLPLMTGTGCSRCERLARGVGALIGAAISRGERLVRLGCGTDAVISSAFLGDFCTPVCEERRAGVAVFSSGWGLAFTGLDIGAAVCAARRESLRPVSSEGFFWTASSTFLSAAVFGVLTATFAARGDGRLGFVITGGLGGLAAARGDALRLGATSCGAGGLAVTRGAIEGCFFASPCVRCRPSGRVRGASVVPCTRGRDAMPCTCGRDAMPCTRGRDASCP